MECCILDLLAYISSYRFCSVSEKETRFDLTLMTLMFALPPVERFVRLVENAPGRGDLLVRRDEGYVTSETHIPIIYQQAVLSCTKVGT